MSKLPQIFNQNQNGKSKSKVERAMKELKAFKKVELSPSEKQKLTLTVKVEDLAFYNEKSSAYLAELMEKHGLDKGDERIYFAQLLGMSDHISYNLAHNGYNVAKYVPFGPVRDVMPYLIRRAEENTSVAGQTSRELNLIKTEKKRRKL